MLLDALRLLLAVALLVAVPGWLLVRALFPKPGALRVSEQIFLTLAGGILVAMLVGIVLGFLPHGERGALQSLPARGMPNVELAMIGASLLLFWAGAHRGAYPAFSARFPRFASPWAQLKVGNEQP